jgi:adenylate cyclase
LAPYGIALGCLGAFQISGIGESLNLLIYDTAVVWRPAPSGSRWPIRLIGLSEADIRRFGWPLKDSLLVRAIDRLRAQGVIAIGIDFYRDNGVEPGVALLRERIRHDPRIVTIFNAAEGISSPPGTPTKQKSFNDLIVDADGVVRRDLVHVEGQPPEVVSLPLRLFELAQGNQRLRDHFKDGRLDRSWLSRDSGGYRNQDTAGLQRMLAYYKPNSFLSWSFGDLLDGAIPSRELKGSIVLMGSRAPSLRDSFETPFTRFGHQANLVTMDGIEVHAQRLAGLMDRQAGSHFQMEALPSWLNHGLLLLTLGVGLVVGERPKSLARSAFLLVLLEAILLGGSVGLLGLGFWLGISLPMAGLGVMVVASWMRRANASQEQRRQFERLLGQTTSPAVAAELWNQRETLLLDGRFPGRELPLTVMLADTVHFSSVGEWMAPTELLDWFNTGMKIFVEIINRHGGMVNKFTGDGFLAVFGAPLPLDAKQNAEAAVSAAREIQQAIDHLLVDLKQKQLPPIRLRIGISSGPVITGSMGGSSRMEYAVLGDAVNISARLEALNKERMSNDCRVLLSLATKELLEEGRWRLTAWGPQPVKGREQTVDVYELESGEGVGSLASANP